MLTTEVALYCCLACEKKNKTVDERTVVYALIGDDVGLLR